MSNIKSISTKELVEELIRRDGVKVKEIEPHKEERISVCGPAKVLIVID